MSQQFHCLPSQIWGFDEATPKGYFFNRGVWLFGRMVEADMNNAEAQARKNRKGASADKLANGARLRVLSKHLKEEIKRFKDVGSNDIQGDPNRPDNPFTDQPNKESKDESIIMPW